MKTLDDKLAELPPERSARIMLSSRIHDEMAETKYRIDELTRGYSADSESPRVQSGTVVPTAGMYAELRALCRNMLDALECLSPAVEMYADRNGELHVLCHDMLNALEYLGCDYDILHKFRSRLHNVPQCRGL